MLKHRCTLDLIGGTVVVILALALGAALVILSLRELKSPEQTKPWIDTEHNLACYIQGKELYCISTTIESSTSTQ